MENICTSTVSMPLANHFAKLGDSPKYIQVACFCYMFTEHRDPYATLFPQDEEKATAAVAPPERPVLLESQRPCRDQVYESNINIGSFLRS